MKIYRFTVIINQHWKPDIDYIVTDEEAGLIQKAMDEGRRFEDTKELENLYERVSFAAKESLEEDMGVIESGVDPDELGFWLEFESCIDGGYIV